MFTVYKGGCGSRHPKSYRMSRPHGSSDFVVLIIRTAGIFCIAEKEYEVQAGAALVFTPGVTYSYSNPGGVYMDDWLHFTSSDDDILSKLHKIANVPFRIGDVDFFTRTIRQILWENSYTQGDFRQANLKALFTLLFNHLYAAHEEQDALSKRSPYQEKLQLIRLKLQEDYSVRPTIHEQATFLHVSDSHFQRLYKDFFGIAYQTDVINLRVEYIKYLLDTTNMTMDHIAESLGYSSLVHFYRQFKKTTGITPYQYRRRATNQGKELSFTQKDNA